jgi:hypothetical protein
MKPALVVACICLMIGGDVLTSLAFNAGLPFWNIGILIKSPIQLIFLVMILRYKEFHFVYLIIFLLCLCWLIGFTTTYVNYGGIRDNTYGLDFEGTELNGHPYWISFTVLNRYLLFFAIMPMLLLHAQDQRFISACKNAFECFFYLNSLAIILGYLFKIELFSSYHSQPGELSSDSRFGYKGLLYGINETTGIYFLGLAYAYREIFFYGKKKYLLLFLLLVASLLTGAKGCIIAVLLLTCYFLFRFRRRLFFLIFFPALLGGLVYLIKIDFLAQMSMLLNLYLTLDDTTPVGAFLTFFMTGRNLYIYHNWIYMLSHWNVLNYLFGDGVLYSETDLFDLYYFFGAGAILYLYGYAKLVFMQSLPAT